ncbi:putative acyl-CoA synthetase [Escherichia coli]|uniref:Putative acyl-CoA synthetase n=1 Tax=Escherichia coli TaxID=562 RepID=A0A2X3JDS5_ECOLX|nr:putative acyl-CoA synthetase [Escherichia coli]
MLRLPRWRWDALWSRNGKLATLSEETCQKLRDALPGHVAISNPLDLRDDASSEHYIKTLDILLHSQDFDALMVIHSPSAAAPATESAQVLIEAVKHHPPQQVCFSADELVWRTLLARGTTIIQRSRAADLPYPGRNHHCFYAYGGVPA